MPIFVDARVPVVFGGLSSAGPGDAVLAEGDAVVPAGVTVVRFDLCQPGHPSDCACCAPRGAVAAALRDLFVARARAAVPWFNRVLVVARAEGAAAVRQALADDGFLAGRYRLG
jgi:hypothetical protein